MSGHFDYEAEHWVPGPPVTVRLDAQTGICVYIVPVIDNPTNECVLDLKIHSVDAPMNDSLFVRDSHYPAGLIILSAQDNKVNDGQR